MEWELYWVCSKYPDTSYYKGKNQKNVQENEEARRKRKDPKRHKACTAVHLPPRAVVGLTVSPWWDLSLPVCFLFQRCVLCSFGASIWAAGFAYIGSFWASFASFFDPHGLSRSILSSITWLITCKSTIKTRKMPKNA